MGEGLPQGLGTPYIYKRFILRSCTEKRATVRSIKTGLQRAQQWLKKVAKVRALRETFIEELGGMYEAEEMQVEIPVEAPTETIIEQVDDNITEVSMNEL